MYSRPSTSRMRQPLADSTKRGAPPTADHARTGEFTPPGIARRARANHISEVCLDTVVKIGPPSRLQLEHAGKRDAKPRYLATLENCETKLLQRILRNTTHRASTHIAELVSREPRAGLGRPDAGCFGGRERQARNRPLVDYPQGWIKLLATRGVVLGRFFSHAVGRSLESGS